MGDVLPFPERKPTKAPATEILWPQGEYAIEYIKSYERMKKALKKIVDMPFDGQEYVDDMGYLQSRWLCEMDVRDYLIDACETADRVLRGKEP